MSLRTTGLAYAKKLACVSPVSGGSCHQVMAQAGHNNSPSSLQATQKRGNTASRIVLKCLFPSQVIDQPIVPRFNQTDLRILIAQGGVPRIVDSLLTLRQDPEASGRVRFTECCYADHN